MAGFFEAQQEKSWHFFDRAEGTLQSAS